MQPGTRVAVGPHVLHCGECIEVMRSLPDNSVDAIVTDPPYGLSPDRRARTWDDLEALRVVGKGPRGGFMGKAWDAGVPGVTWARDCLRVLKPGGHLVAFSATRTYHRLACAVEDAGFEIRDMIAWLQYQGFPKSLDVSKAIDKMHGAEREVIGVKSYANGTLGPENYGTAPTTARGFGVGDTGGVGDFDAKRSVTAPATDDAKRWHGWGTALKPAIEPHVLARKPLEKGLTVAQNVLKWGTGALNIDACRYAVGDAAWPGPGEGYGRTAAKSDGTMSKNERVLGAGAGLRGHVVGDFASTEYAHDLGRWPANIYRCPKPSRREREAGTDAIAGGNSVAEYREIGSPGAASPRAGSGRTGGRRGNHHPTVKPVGLMRWLLDLVTPPGGVVLDPFAGSGTTLVAAGTAHAIVGIELDPQYCEIVLARTRAALEAIS